MVAATIAMAHSLGLQTVAEGVENADQLPFLHVHGCDEVQGYVFGRPADAQTTDALLRRRGVGRSWTTLHGVPAKTASRKSSTDTARPRRVISGGAEPL